MLALAWPWGDLATGGVRVTAARLGSSLCAGIGGHSGTVETGKLSLAYRALRFTPASAKAWRPAILPDGRTAIFHGYFDNAEAIATELGADNHDLASLYARAVAEWGDQADLKIVGDYCAVIADQSGQRLRLSRSPLRAPPLYYFHDADMAVAGSVPRIFFAAGVPQRLNERRVSDSGMINFLDQEASWFEAIHRVPIGSIVELRHGHPRVLRRFYDHLDIPEVNVKSDSECIARVRELLDEAVRVCLDGFKRPGVTLSGGLDSPQVAVRALAALPPGQKLPTFTFHPEPGYDGIVQAASTGNERPLVEAFARLHPAIEPHFTANEGYGHDHRWNDLFHLMGGAPSGLCNMYVFHGLFAGAARQGCDLLVLSEWGNNAFSDKGYWGFVEYFFKGRWRQLWLALRKFPIQERSMLWRFVAQCVLPLLPTRLWRLARKIVFPKERSYLELMQPFTFDYRQSSGADARLRESGLVFDRYQPWNARHHRQLLLQNDDGEGAEIYQAFEQMYGVPQRDPMAYRPLVEYCWSLPTRMFMRDGEMRWLAKQVAMGIMPEEQRANRLNGRWDADWHLRIGRRREEFLAEFDRLAHNDRVARMIDLPRMRQLLEDWPDQTEIDPQKSAPRQFTISRALLTARFVNYVEGRNEL
jgi:asparagine synthase (glutamine-hydrolysing)